MNDDEEFSTFDKEMMRQGADKEHIRHIEWLRSLQKKYNWTEAEVQDLLRPTRREFPPFRYSEPEPKVCPTCGARKTR